MHADAEKRMGISPTDHSAWPVCFALVPLSRPVLSLATANAWHATAKVKESSELQEK
jgi:hypothetical protein